MNLMKDCRVAETRSWLAKLKSAWAITPSKIVEIKILISHVHLHIIGRKSKKFQMNPMKNIGGVAETRLWLAKFNSAWAITPSKNCRIKILKPYAHLHIIGSKQTKFQVNPMKDVGGDAETRSHGRTAGRTEGRTDDRTNGRTDRWKNGRTE